MGNCCAKPATTQKTVAPENVGTSAPPHPQEEKKKKEQQQQPQKQEAPKVVAPAPESAVAASATTTATTNEAVVVDENKQETKEVEEPKQPAQEEQADVTVTKDEQPAAPPVATAITTGNESLVSKQKIIFVLGGPGSGKGTVCSKLVSAYRLKHLSAGDLLREEVKERPDSELSEQINEHMKNGTLVPATVIVPLLKQKIKFTASSSESVVAGFLVDGFPRETSQAQLFENEITAPAHVLFLDCSEETMLKRLLKRAETSGRVDDNEETIRKRFETFQNQSLPVVDHYGAQNLVAKINGNGTPDEAYAQVKEAMDKIFPSSS